MNSVSQRAREYVLSLGRDQVTARQKQVLLAIAEAYSDRYNSANFSNRQLGDDILMGERQLGRVLMALDEKGLISYCPGRGAGNYSFCSFPELKKPDIKATETRHKPVINPSSWDSVIRKENLNLNPDPDGAGFEVQESAHSKKGSQAVSSSAKRDDDTENNALIARVLAAFECNPVTTGKSTAADVATARRLLRQYTPEEIEAGILLGSARKAGSLGNAAQEPHSEQSCDASAAGPKVRSLAYFVDAILEAKSDPNINPGYAQYLRHCLDRFQAKTRKQPQKVPVPA